MLVQSVNKTYPHIHQMKHTERKRNLMRKHTASADVQLCVRENARKALGSLLTKQNTCIYVY